VLLSATTWLRGGFDRPQAYLGLARAASPPRTRSASRCRWPRFRAPEPSTTRACSSAVPRDAPPVADKQRYLDYAARFIGYLGERTRGRLLALFTNAEDLAAVGARSSRSSPRAACRSGGSACAA
jgi:hypothetical protein